MKRSIVIVSMKKSPFLELISAPSLMRYITLLRIPFSTAI